MRKPSDCRSVKLSMYAGNKLSIFIITSFVLDRKSTRLNSSHVEISYAVFCLKKKKKKKHKILSLPLIFFFFLFFFLIILRPPRSTLFPTRRSSDLHVIQKFFFCDIACAKKVSCNAQAF